MSSRWFNTVIVVMWLATMSWLVKEKVLPPLLIGEAPSYSEIIEAQNHELPVGWDVYLDGRWIGWAMTDTKQQKSGVTEIHGRAHFDAFPIAVVTPGWLQPFSRFVAKPIKELRLDARSELSIDSFGRLLRFDSAVRLEPCDETVSMKGVVEGGQLQFVVRTGELTFSYELPLPPKSLLSDALSPQSRLPGLHVGQTWSVPIFNPLWPSKSPIEIISAKVEDTQPVFWGGVHENAFLVVYRHDLGSGAVGGQDTTKGKLLVRRDGAVLRQEMTLSNSTILFVRMTDKVAGKLLDDAGPLWWTFDGKPVGGRVK
jgi:hypothetical protein